VVYGGAAFALDDLAVSILLNDHEQLFVNVIGHGGVDRRYAGFAESSAIL
jgi:hypothetical protein